MFDKLKKKFSDVFSKATSDKVVEKKEEKKPNTLKKALSGVLKKKISENDFEEIWYEIEVFLYEINVAHKIVDLIKKKLKEEIIDSVFSRISLQKKFLEILKKEAYDVLKKREKDFLKDFLEIKKKNGVVKILILGINGSGKTTTISKLIKFFQKNNLSLCVSASDTFRAAAIEQLERHCDKLKVRLIKHRQGSDPSAVAYDSVEHAKSKNLDCVIIDTAGRIPNNENLANELKKIDRVIKPDFKLFVVDSNSGNDIIEQLDMFDNIINLDGVILTKVDTDEKPGSIISVSYETTKPIYFIGIGQNLEDLKSFNSKEISDKLFD